MRHCADAIGRETITIAEYETIGKVHPSTLRRRFGSWFKALELAGLKPSRSKFGITDDELFENIKSLWIRLGRQPKYEEVKSPDSHFSAGTYENRFGSWSNALKAFIVWSGSDTSENIQQDIDEEQNLPESRLDTSVIHRTRREISDRQRFRILVRDGFQCKACGASPLRTPGVELHVDHILPWSKGGETVDKNLETKCKKCNLGKGNSFNV
jgi:5-methylcytosine-specific restriction endonuclease McrA